MHKFNTWVISLNNFILGYWLFIMKATIKAIEEQLGETSIAVSEQSYLKSFYNSFGLQETGEEYLADGIPHMMVVKG